MNKNQFFNTSLRLSYPIALILLTVSINTYGQKKATVLDSSEAGYIKTIAGDYKTNGIHKILLGKNYHPEWATIVRIPVMKLDTIMGGLTPVKGGGGRQSKSLHLHDQQNRTYIMRSIDKSFGRAIPDIYQNTFIEDLVNDQVTIGHPYSALTIPPMAKAAKIYHAIPRMLYLPAQPALDTFNDQYGNSLYMLEQRADDNWETAPNFGNPENAIGTYKMLKKLQKDNDNRVDQPLYARSRLFDMFIGDWGRHEDQWRWGEHEEGGKKIYRPIPRDRDQAYTKFGGLLTKGILGAGGLSHLQSFDYEIKKLMIYNFPARHLDRQCANELTMEQWISIAKDLQQKLTDQVIESAIKQMPQEVFPISGNEIIAKLKSRRDHLHEYAEAYYKFLAWNVEITGTEGREYFEVKRVNDNETQVNLYNIKKNGSTESTPYYSRLFKRDETDEIRLFGISGKDKYTVGGKVNRGIMVRMIGGRDRDTMIDNSEVAHGKKKTEMDDDGENMNITSPETRQHISTDSENYAYNYKEYEYDKKGISGEIYYKNPDKFYVGLGYKFKQRMWRKYPYGTTHEIQGRYSLTENSLSIYYSAKFFQSIGKWNLNLDAYYDVLRSTNFYGLGNETHDSAQSRPYNRLKSKEAGGIIGLTRIFKSHHHVGINATVKAIELLHESGAFVGDTYKPTQAYLFDYQKFVVGNAGYTYQNVNDPTVPTKGAMFYVGASYTQNLEKPKGFATYYGILHLYIPLSKKFSISTRTGVKSVSGDPEFFQYAAIGGAQTLRGYQRDRFAGNTAFYNTNELRYMTNLRTYIMNGKIGLVGLFDNGRVWLDGENSDKWHYAVGGGLLLAPFNKATFTFSYAVSEEGGRLQVRLTKLFFKESTMESRVRL